MKAWITKEVQTMNKDEQMRRRAEELLDDSYKRFITACEVKDEEDVLKYKHDIKMLAFILGGYDCLDRARDDLKRTEQEHWGKWME